MENERVKEKKEGKRASANGLGEHRNEESRVKSIQRDWGCWKSNIDFLISG